MNPQIPNSTPEFDRVEFSSVVEFIDLRSHWVCLLKERFCPRGEGDFVPEGESQGDGSISGLLWGHFQKSQG